MPGISVRESNIHAAQLALHVGRALLRRVGCFSPLLSSIGDLMVALLWALVRSVLLSAVLATVACSGGGSSTSSPPAFANQQLTASPTPSVAPTPSPTPTPVAVSGKVADLISGSALAGFTVTFGALPNAATCLAAQTAITEPCGVVASPLPTVTTAADGTFNTTVPTAEIYMLTISKDTTFATLHRTIVLSGTPLGTLSVTALSADEQAWLTDVNSKRAMVSFPVSFPNLVVDEYAEEQARAEVAAIVSGAQPYGDPTEGLFGSMLQHEAGDMYGGGRGVSDLVPSAGAFLQADTNWVDDEKPNCPNGDWLTCTFSGSTGHYINVSATDNVWIGMAESAMSFSNPPYGSEWAYAMLMPANVTQNDPNPLGRPRR